MNDRINGKCIKCEEMCSDFDSDQPSIKFPIYKDGVTLNWERIHVGCIRLYQIEAKELKEGITKFLIAMNGIPPQKEYKILEKLLKESK